MNGPGIPNPLEAAYSRRNFLRFGTATVVITAAFVAENKLHTISSLFSGPISPDYKAAEKAAQLAAETTTPSTTVEMSTTMPVKTTESTAADYDTTTSSSSSTTTSTTELATTTTAETLPPGPEYLDVPQPYELDQKTGKGMIGEVSITNPGAEKPFISGFLYETDDPNNPRIPFPPKLDGSPADYLTPYIDLGPGHNGGTAFPGQKGNCVVFFHRTTHGAPGRRMDEVMPDATVTYTYASPTTNPQLRGVSRSYRVVGAPISILEADASAYISAQDPSTPAITTIYTCDPPYSAKDRLFVKAVLIPPDQPSS